VADKIEMTERITVSLDSVREVWLLCHNLLAKLPLIVFISAGLARQTFGEIGFADAATVDVRY
jgi:hypothetical protein